MNGRIVFLLLDPRVDPAEAAKSLILAAKANTTEAGLFVSQNTPVVRESSTVGDEVLFHLRAEIAEGNLPAECLLVVYQAPNGSTRDIHFNDRGTPDWWPTTFGQGLRKGVDRIKAALAARDHATLPKP